MHTHREKDRSTHIKPKKLLVNRENIRKWITPREGQKERERRRRSREGQTSRTHSNAHSKNENLTLEKLWKYVTCIDKNHQNGCQTKKFHWFFFSDANRLRIWEIQRDEIEKAVHKIVCCARHIRLWSIQRFLIGDDGTETIDFASGFW